MSWGILSSRIFFGLLRYVLAVGLVNQPQAPARQGQNYLQTDDMLNRGFWGEY
jgi:hypothetical protein